MRQSITLLAELLSSYARIVQTPGIDSRAQAAYQALLIYLQQYSIQPTLLQNNTTFTAQQFESALSALPTEAIPELMALFQAAIHSFEACQPSEGVGVSLEEIKAQFLKIRDVVADGSGVKISRSLVDTGIEIEHIAANSTQTNTLSSAPMPVVELTDVEVGGDLKIGPILQIVKQFIQGTPDDVRAMQQRLDMLALVENIWIKGILHPLQQGETQLQLHLCAVPELVDNRPFAEFIQTPALPAAPFSAQEDIVSISQQFQHRLLVVGEPGSGKTTLLLQLAQASIAVARQKIVQPLPIIFHLASWSPAHDSLQSWILSEMKEKYRVPHKTVEPWLADASLLLILDGLDEVREEDRLACVGAINKFLTEYSVGVVVGCRKREYVALHEHLHLPMGVEIQPLTEDQVTAYLAAKQLDQSPLVTVIHTNEKVGELAQSPLGLHILAIAAQQESTLIWTEGLSSQAWQDQLFATYLSTMFKRRSGRHPYSPEQTVTWLRWLAQQMMAQNQSIFLLEQMQPNLLASQRQRLLYQIMLRCAGSLPFLLSCPLIVVILMLVTGTSLQYIPSGIGLGVVLGGVISAALILTSILARWLYGLLAIVLALGALAALLAAGLGMLPSLITGDDPLTTAVLIALIFGTLGSLPGVLLSGKHPIQPMSEFSWSWTGVRTALLLGVLGSIGIGLLVGLVLDIANGIWIGFMIGLCCIVPMSLFSLSKRGQIRSSIYPNQGIRNSSYTATLLFVLIAFVAGSIGVLWHLFDSSQASRLTDALAVGVILGVPIAISAALTAGGATALQHYLLRGLLASSGTLPWKLQHFLDYATDRVFLSRIGGSYIFYHRLLMEYLANSKETIYGNRR